MIQPGVFTAYIMLFIVSKAGLTQARISSVINSLLGNHAYLQRMFLRDFKNLL